MDLRTLLIAIFFLCASTSSAAAGGIFGEKCPGLRGIWKLENALEQASQEAKRFPAVANEICERLKREQAASYGSGAPNTSPFQSGTSPSPFKSGPSDSPFRSGSRVSSYNGDSSTSQYSPTPQYEPEPRPDYDSPAVMAEAVNPRQYIDDLVAASAAEEARVEQQRAEREAARVQRVAEAEQRRADAIAAREAATREKAAREAAAERAAAVAVATEARNRAVALWTKRIGISVLVGLLGWWAWSARATILHIAYGITPHRRPVWRTPSPETEPPAQPNSGEPIMADQPRAMTPSTGGPKPLVRSNPLPAAPLGIPLLGVLRNSWEKGQVESYTELEKAITAHVVALKEQLEQKGQLIDSEAHWEGRVSQLGALREKSALTVGQETEAVRAQGALAQRKAEVELARYNLELKRLQKITDDLDDPVAKPQAMSEADRLSKMLQKGREFEAAFDIHISEVIAKAGGEENLTDSDRSHIDMIEMLKATKGADYYEGLT